MRIGFAIRVGIGSLPSEVYLLFVLISGRDSPSLNYALIYIGPDDLSMGKMNLFLFFLGVPEANFGNMGPED